MSIGQACALSKLGLVVDRKLGKINMFLLINYLPFIHAFVWETGIGSCIRFIGFVDIFAYKFAMAIT